MSMGAIGTNDRYVIEAFDSVIRMDIKTRFTQPRAAEMDAPECSCPDPCDCDHDNE